MVLVTHKRNVLFPLYELLFVLGLSDMIVSSTFHRRGEHTKVYVGMEVGVQHYYVRAEFAQKQKWNQNTPTEFLLPLEQFVSDDAFIQLLRKECVNQAHQSENKTNESH